MMAIRLPVAGASVSILLLSTLCCIKPATAGDPSFWDKAAQPRLARDVVALRDAEKAFLQARVMRGSRAKTLLREAVRILEDVDAATSPDPRVRFFYGRMLGRVEEDERAIAVLRGAIAHAPQHPSVGEAFFSLAISYARLGRTKEEIRAYDAWLEREPSRRHRSTGLANQAEGYMAAGRMDEAVRAYKSAVQLSHDNALAHWGLAVALDRTGDPAGALHEARVALTYDPDARQLRGPSVFFVPAHDSFWYQALGAMARASAASDPDLAASWWDRATLFWQQYIDASPVDDRWGPLARLRHAFCEQATREARARDRSRKRP